jgi:hypothetical protein
MKPESDDLIWKACQIRALLRGLMILMDEAIPSGHEDCWKIRIDALEAIKCQVDVLHDLAGKLAEVMERSPDSVSIAKVAT